MGAWISLLLAVPKCARNPMHSPHKKAAKPNEDGTVAKQSSLLTFSQLVFLETFKILIISFANKHISLIFLIFRNLVCCRYKRCIGEFATVFRSAFARDTQAPPQASWCGGRHQLQLNVTFDVSAG